MIKITDKKRFAIFVSVAAVIIATGVFWLYQKVQKNINPDRKLTLQEAAKMGEAATHKLLIKIANPQGRAEDASGRYERGDIVLILPASHQFSTAEQEGFLIVEMELTPKQAEILTQTKLAEETFWQKITKDSPKDASKQLKRRKFTVDLSKIGIAPDDQKGREIEDKVFTWDIVNEKQ